MAHVFVRVREQPEIDTADGGLLSEEMLGAIELRAGNRFAGCRQGPLQHTYESIFFAYRLVELVVYADQAPKTLQTLGWKFAIQIDGRGHADEIQQHEIAGRDVDQYFAHRPRFLIRPPMVLRGWYGFGKGDQLVFDDFEFPQELAWKTFDAGSRGHVQQDTNPKPPAGPEEATAALLCWEASSASRMPTISSFYGILIRMFFNDHAPPHFHARYGEFEATIVIGTLEVIHGQLPSRAFEPSKGTGDDK